VGAPDSFANPLRPFGPPPPSLRSGGGLVSLRLTVPSLAPRSKNP